MTFRRKALLFDAQTHRLSTGSSAPIDALTQIYRLQEATSFNAPEFLCYLGSPMLKRSKSASRINQGMINYPLIMQLACLLDPFCCLFLLVFMHGQHCLLLPTNGVFSKRSSLGREDHSIPVKPLDRASGQSTRCPFNPFQELLAHRADYSLIILIISKIINTH